MTDIGNDTTTVEHLTGAVEHLTGDEGSTAAAIAWLESEFPGWTVDIDRTATWRGAHRPLWIARRDGHHPQSELTAAKLHSRLADYLDREDRRRAMMN